MNAKQIADELENIYWIQGDGKGKPFQQYADFVRQQQAQIEALKKEAALQRLSDFTQEADNEPVAIRYDFDGYGYQYMDSGSGSDWQTRVEGEFLYTHPANKKVEENTDLYEKVCNCTKKLDLTDEEIKQIAVECGVYINEQGSIYPDDICIYSFARAILRKAQEK